MAELMGALADVGQAIIAADGDRLWLVLDDLEQLLGRWRSALRAAQSPVPVEGAMSTMGTRQ
jgi:hypothetical protein